MKKLTKPLIIQELRILKSLTDLMKTYLWMTNKLETMASKYPELKSFTLLVGYLLIIKENGFMNLIITASRQIGCPIWLNRLEISIEEVKKRQNFKPILYKEPRKKFLLMKKKENKQPGQLLLRKKSRLVKKTKKKMKMKERRRRQLKF
jgi:hypothetical protein